MSVDSSTEMHREIGRALDADGVVILPPLEVEDTLRICRELPSRVACTMLDPWYNKGVGGVRDDYDAHVSTMLTLAGTLSDHVYFWGFPEIVARYVERLPEGLSLTAWLTWYYKNNPSVIRGWRSSQMACLHLSRPGAPLFPEHFLNDRQLEKQRQGKLRYIPGPTSVLEDAPDADEETLFAPSSVIVEPLLIGFVRRDEQTGHPAQKPERVYEKLLLMVTKPGDLVVDPMAGSGTTGKVALDQGRRAILADHSEDYTAMMEQRLGRRRLEIKPD